jgi:hypothetical protein
VDVPIGYTSSGTTPMGMQILGQAWTEPALIGFAYSYEQATHRRVPATVADPALVCSAKTTASATGGSPGAVAGASAGGTLPNTDGGVAPSVGGIAEAGALVAAAWVARRRRT